MISYIWSSWSLKFSGFPLIYSFLWLCPPFKNVSSDGHSFQSQLLLLFLTCLSQLPHVPCLQAHPSSFWLSSAFVALGAGPSGCFSSPSDWENEAPGASLKYHCQFNHHFGHFTTQLRQVYISYTFYLPSPMIDKQDGYLTYKIIIANDVSWFHTFDHPDHSNSRDSSHHSFLVDPPFKNFIWWTFISINNYYYCFLHVFPNCHMFRLQAILPLLLADSSSAFVALGAGPSGCFSSPSDWEMKLQVHPWNIVVNLIIIRSVYHSTSTGLHFIRILFTIPNDWYTRWLSYIQDNYC